MLHIIKSDQCLSDIIKHIKQLITRLECDQYYWSEGDGHYREVLMPWSNATIKIYLILVIRNMNIWDQRVSDIICLNCSTRRLNDQLTLIPCITLLDRDLKIKPIPAKHWYYSS